ncbi:MAG: hypothetical protein U9Q66_01640 [Patescibacteria group bacterium]|nr:hypothetical protein [Patescibacteria group bacterium]
MRYSVNGNVCTINDSIDIDINTEYNIDIIVDRLVIKNYSDKVNSEGREGALANKESSDTKRLKDSLELAFKS